MRIKNVRLTNYKGFRDTGAVAFGDKFTVLVGQNNAGKTAFLEALSIGTFQNKPYRVNTKPGAFPPVQNPTSVITFDIKFGGDELRWWALNTGTQFSMTGSTGNLESLNNQVDKFFSTSIIEVGAKFFQGGGWQPVKNTSLPLAPNPDHHVILQASPDRQSIKIGSVNAGVSETIVQQLICPYLQSSLYVFRAERMNVPECTIQGGIELRPDASNLASVLLQLDVDPTSLERFTSYLRMIFPTIYSVVSRPKSDQPTTAIIEVINRDFENEIWRPGVSIPLADSGTGISQVLAILYVVVTARTPRILVIDEPNTFLHPGAVRKLFSILKELDHQYIITTHSSDIIRTIKPEVIHLVKWTGRESVIETLDGEDINDIRRILQELGVRLSDVFGADSVLWVEGPTEEICFPILLEHSGHPLSAATAVVAMVNTGDLESRRTRRSLAWEVYERISVGSALIPPALAFSFDQEGRTTIEVDDMVRRSSGRAHFLPRLTYENYLLDAEAISAVLQSSNVTKPPVEVQAWIQAHGATRKYFSAEVVPLEDAKWAVTIHAPKLLQDLFWELSANTLEYDKVRHSVALTKWILEHKADQLRELVEYVVSLLSSTAPSAANSQREKS